MKPVFTILGGGIGGLTTALALRRIGINATVYEAAPHLSEVGAGILLAANAIKGFQKIGLADKIVPLGLLLPAFRLLDYKGKTISEADASVLASKYGLHNFSIHRADLQLALAQELGSDGIVFNKRATGFSREKDRILVHFTDDTTVETDFLIAADGIHSPIRRQMMPHSTPRYAGYTCWRSVISAQNIPYNIASESWGAGARVGIVPLSGQRIYYFAVKNAPANDPAMKAATPTDLARMFAGFHEPVQQLFEQTDASKLLWNDICDLKPLEHLAYGNVLLLGDAGHATTPNLGQGACQAIEDAVVLADELSLQPSNPAAAFQAFERRRLKRVHMIVNTSRQMGRMAHWENPLLMAARNNLLRLVPESVNERQLKALLEVDF